jgi:hypothetical protein
MSQKLLQTFQAFFGQFHMFWAFFAELAAKNPIFVRTGIFTLLKMLTMLAFPVEHTASTTYGFAFYTPESHVPVPTQAYLAGILFRPGIR